MRVRFFGGPWDQEQRNIPEPLPTRWEVPGLRFGSPARRHSVLSHGNVRDVLDLVDYPTVTYERAQRLSDSGVEVCYVESRLYRAELEAQRTGERRDRLTAQAIEWWGQAPDLRRFLDEPNLAAQIWWCGDEVCDCSQAQVIGWMGAYNLDGDSATYNPHGGSGELVFPYARTHRGVATLWRGVFYSEGAIGAGEDLQFLRIYLEEFASDIAGAIRWPPPM